MRLYMDATGRDEAMPRLYRIDKTMRILAGKFKGRVIKMPKGIRPTQQKVRKAIFDILSERLEGALFLELFAGSGAVGIEAFSQGAESVCFVEKDRQCLRLIAENLKSLGIDSFDLLSEDADAAIEILASQNKKFDIVFLDPPYYQDLAKKTLLSLASYDILFPNAFVAVQHHEKEELPNSLSNLKLYKKYSYSGNQLSFYYKSQ